MRAVVQRVHRAEVTTPCGHRDSSGPGLLVFLGVEAGDTAEDRGWMVGKVAGLRVFPDEEGRMNRSVRDCDGEVMVISQFTLFGNMKKGTRPSFNRAAQPDCASDEYQAFVAALGTALAGKRIAVGRFAAHMDITAVNDGPVTIIIDSRAREI